MLDHVIFDSGGTSSGGCFSLLDHGDELFDPGGAVAGGYVSLGTFLGISLSHGVASLGHGHVLFDPGGTSSGGYFTTFKVFEAYNFNHQDSKISLSCQRRVGEQRLCDHTFPQAEFAKDGSNSRRVRFEEGWTDAGAKCLDEENMSLDEDIKQLRVSRVKKKRRIGRIRPKQSLKQVKKGKFVAQCFVHGDSFNSCLVAIVAVEQYILRDWAESARIKYGNLRQKAYFAKDMFVVLRPNMTRYSSMEEVNAALVEVEEHERGHDDAIDSESYSGAGPEGYEDTGSIDPEGHEDRGSKKPTGAGRPLSGRPTPLLVDQTEGFRA